MKTKFEIDWEKMLGVSAAATLVGLAVCYVAKYYESDWLYLVSAFTGISLMLNIISYIKYAVKEEQDNLM